MIPSPIRKALSSIQQHQIQALLMGGQACVLYGGAEFSRDLDLALFASPANLARLELALQDLGATHIAVPPFALEFLLRGHAVHFRCTAAAVDGLRLDLMSQMRGVADFVTLWDRRTTFTIDGQPIDVLSLPDLVQAKKTQRDKDWPMIRRLVEAHYFAGRDTASAEAVAFWFAELRSPSLLVELAAAHRASASQHPRPAVRAAADGDEGKVARALDEEQRAEMAADRVYWEPLRKELEVLRRAR